LNFTKLKLIGFKSFTEPSELIIGPGTTGIVGPNGCGKSNLIEAIRWVMGENSPRQMRSGGMDDVIFNGTDSRSSRNVAEVALLLDNENRTAPPAFNENNEIEVIRRIERGSGSSYKVNGNEVRAKDVQYLFADIATGAHSTALVGQGRISDIINARPQNRRGILEEAAGISGLHARRHEAELRLRAAETNLGRLQDVIDTLDEQMRALKRQSRQANRYRRISDNLRDAEALLFRLRLIEAENDLALSEEKIFSAEDVVVKLTANVAIRTNEQSKSSEKLPELRQEEANFAASLHRLAIAGENLDSEEQEIDKQCEEFKSRLVQIDQDLIREKNLSKDAENKTILINQQLSDLIQSKDEYAESEKKAANDYTTSATNLEGLEKSFSELTEKIAQDDARHSSLKRRLQELETQKEGTSSQIVAIQSERERLGESNIHQDSIKNTELAIIEMKSKVDTFQEELRISESTRESAQTEELTARDILQAANAALSQLKAEEQGLQKLFDYSDNNKGSTLLDSIIVESGYEAALGVALGEDIEASQSPTDQIFWSELIPLKADQELPEMTIPLSKFVRGPDVLKRRLDQIGVITGDGEKIKNYLQPGQCIVNKAGALWRWDGLTVKAGAITAAAIRLKQRNRLNELGKELKTATNVHKQAEQSLLHLVENLHLAVKHNSVARKNFEQISENLHSLHEQLSKLTHEAIEENSRLSALDARLESLHNELTDNTISIQQTMESLKVFESSKINQNELSVQRSQLSVLRRDHDEKTRIYDRLSREASQHQQQLKNLNIEKQDWSQRLIGANVRLYDLKSRREEVSQKLNKLAERPQEIVEQRSILLDKISMIEKERNTAAEQLAQCEDELRNMNSELKTSEQALASAREERVRAEGIHEQAKQMVQNIVSQIEERLSCSPKELSSNTPLPQTDKLPEIEAIENRMQRLTRERENIGAVNLRAEEEANELGQQISSLASEREDLEAAIFKLRQGISNLNRDGRQRVTEAFKTIDNHFSKLFTRLYGGGHAHLELVESDDPLEAGLEIMASPPGKKLQSLSLLSGGEKALTALALLFAVFLTNPAPICVLDEVDAPLDDNNVDRFCSLVSELAKDSGTRFLIVTHHRMTMSRVDRLFGVTMIERGISQLVSVDLARAEEWRDNN